MLTPRAIALVALPFLALLLSVNLIESAQRPTIKVSYSSLTKEARRQVDCLADNIYFEAGHEPDKGKIAVGLVTMNRVNSGKYPSTVCGVVTQKVSTTCQFTWWCHPDTKTKSIRRSFASNERDSYLKSRLVALHVYLNYEKIEDVTGGAMFYHANYVSPQWRGLEKTIEIGQHIFYKQRNQHRYTSD